MASEAHGRFQWNELLTHDVEAARDFYTPIMEWDYDKMTGPDGAYVVAFKQNVPICGISPMPPTHRPDTPAFWLGYIEVDAVDDAVSKAQQAGATVIRAPFDLPEIGRVAVIKDPAGALIGWVTPDFKD